MSDKLVVIAKYADSAQASLAQQLLADFGIKSFTSGENAANIYSGLLQIAEVELHTFQSRAKEAIEILKSKDGQEE